MSTDTERLRRWRLILGGQEADGTGLRLRGVDQAIDDALAGLGIPAFVCTPDLFPELVAAAIRREEIVAWATACGIVTARGVAAP